MSIVGNRPLPVYEAEMLTADTLSKRFLAPAGITGLWQVELRGKGGSMSELERIELDKRLLSNFYKNNGYYNVRITNSFVEFNNNNSFKLIFNIEAGEKFKFNDLSLKL